MGPQRRDTTPTPEVIKGFLEARRSRVGVGFQAEEQSTQRPTDLGSSGLSVESHEQGQLRMAGGLFETLIVPLNPHDGSTRKVEMQSPVC